MEEKRSFAARALNIIGFGLLAFAITILAGGIWSALLVANLRSSPAVPWSVLAMALLLWLMWRYLAGKGWPRSTSDARRHYLRANRRSARTYLWSFAAGVLSVIALAGYWIVLFRLVKMPPNALPSMSSYPRMTVALMIVMAAGSRAIFPLRVMRFLWLRHSWRRLGFADIFRWPSNESFAVGSRSPSPPSCLPSRTSPMASCGQSFWCTFLSALRLARRRISPTRLFRLFCPT